MQMQTTNKSVEQEAITCTFRLFDDGLGDMPTWTHLMQIKETVSFDLDKVITTTVPVCVFEVLGALRADGP